MFTTYSALSYAVATYQFFVYVSQTIIPFVFSTESLLILFHEFNTALHTFQHIIFNSFVLSSSIGSDAVQQRVVASQQPIQRQNDTSQRNDDAVASTARDVPQSIRKRKRTIIPNSGSFDFF